MKKHLQKLCLVLSIAVTMSTSLMAGTININNQSIKTANSSIVKNNITMVPLRVISENLGATVEFDKPTQTIKINKEDVQLILTLNSNNALVNGQVVKLSANAFIKNNITYVPLRFIAEAFKCNVDYKAGNIFINTGSNTTTSSNLGQTTSSNKTNWKSNALKKAQRYSDNMHMSKKGLYQQLTSEYGEKFTPDEAQYAVDNIKVDWKLNALKKAQSYSDNMHMSKQGIYHQLISEYGEQFTADEAQYAIDNVKANWKLNALKKAQSYSNNMNMSKQSIYQQLISEYGEQFTADEAQYAIDNL